MVVVVSLSIDFVKVIFGISSGKVSLYLNPDQNFHSILNFDDLSMLVYKC